MSTPRGGTSWEWSPEEDFAEVYKNTYTGIDIATNYGVLMPQVNGMEPSCLSVYNQVEQSYAPQQTNVVTLDFSKMFTELTSDWLTPAIEAKINANVTLQACRRKVLLNAKAYPADWEFGGPPYKGTVDQKTKYFVTNFVKGL